MSGGRKRKIIKVIRDFSGFETSQLLLRTLRPVPANWRQAITFGYFPSVLLSHRVTCTHTSTLIIAVTVVWGVIIHHLKEYV